MSPEPSGRVGQEVGHISPHASEDLQAADQISMLRQEVARLNAALEQRADDPNSELGKLRKANRLLHAHVEMLRSNQSASQSESVELSRQNSEIDEVWHARLSKSCRSSDLVLALLWHHTVCATLNLNCCG